VEEQAKLSKKRGLEGNNSDIPCHNSFAVLSDKEIVSRTSMMGITIPNNNFESVDLIRNLEVAKKQLASKNSKSSNEQEKLVVEQAVNSRAPLQLGWQSGEDIEEEPFTVVQSRRDRKKAVKTKISRTGPLTRSQRKANTSPLDPGRNVRRRKTPDKYK
jgi:hypothetical protein